VISESTINNFQKEISSIETDAVLVTNPVDIGYLISKPTLFDEHLSGAILFSSQDPVFLIDKRYFAQALKANLAIELQTWSNQFTEVLNQLLLKKQISSLAIDAEYVTVSQYQQYKERLNVEVVALKLPIKKMRQIKAKSEISKLAEAARLTDNIFKKILAEVKPGISEKDLAMEIEFLLCRYGAEAVSFPPIVASGKNSAFPHAQSSHKQIETGDFLVLDFGCRKNGYCSDLTRTLVVGKASNKQKQLYQLVKEAQQLGLRLLQENKKASEIDGQVRKFFAKSKFEDYFAHGLGHGVGLEIHEPPTLNKLSKEILKPGMVFTIEPGLYLPDFGGVRIEDMVALKSSETEVLTKAPKDLIEL
jgi:Xaa-Pro aminopeptidase